MLWHWSLILSTFALISSAHQRLLRHLPTDRFQENFDEEKIQLALNLFLSPPVRLKETEGNSPKRFRRQSSSRMIWIWQCPTMLMSYSWVLFLVGYALHVLKPVFDPSRTEVSKKVGYNKYPLQTTQQLMLTKTSGRHRDRDRMPSGRRKLHFLCSVMPNTSKEAV